MSNNSIATAHGICCGSRRCDPPVGIAPQLASAEYARGVRAWFRFAAVVNGASENAAADFRRGLVELEDAFRVAGDDPLCLSYVGSAQLYAGRFDEAIVTLARAQARNPNVARAARDDPNFSADRLPPMLSAHPDREQGACRMKLLAGLWHEVND